MVRQMRDAPHHQILQQVSECEQRGGDQRQAQQRIDAERAKEDERGEHAEHHHLAMREIDDADDAENDRQPERAQAIDQPRQQAADGDIEIESAGHVRLDGYASRRWPGRTRFP